MARWLRNRGHDVTVVTGFPNYPSGKVYPGYQIRWRQWEEIDGVRVLRVPLYPSHNRSALGRIANYVSFSACASTIGALLCGPADVVYIYHPPATVGVPGIVLKLFRGLPIVYHIADMWPESVIESGMLGTGLRKKMVEFALARLCNFLYRHTDCITVISPGFKKLLEKRGVPSRKIHVIYNWTTEDAFFPVEKDCVLSKELGFEGHFNVLYAGNLGLFQGLETVIRAAVLLRSIPEIRLVLAGTGAAEQRLREMARELGANNVTFIGNRPYREMAKVNCLAEVMLVHLRDLSFFASTIPSKTQVALACGRPILMAVRGDAAALLNRARAGLSCEPENERAMADAILQFHRMPAERREELGRNGRNFYSREMSLEIGGQHMEKLLLELMPPTSAPAPVAAPDRVRE